MELLRVSKFCRRQTPQQVPVSLSSSIFLHQTSGVPAVADDSIGYVSLEILVRLSVQEGSLAVLSRSQGDSSTVVLRLRLLSDESQSNLNILQVSPIVETNLGIISTSTSGGENNNHEGFCLQGIYDEPRFAQEVVLRPLGRPPSWPEFWKDDDEEDDDSWIFPPSNTRVQPYHLLSVYDSKHEKVYYYEVLKIVAEQQQEVMNDYDDSTACFLTSSSTKFQLDSAPLSSVTRRLPPLISHLQFYQGCKINSNVVAPYPNLSQLKTALASIFSTSASCPQVPPASQLLRSDIPKIRSNEKILHIIGTYHEHNVRNVVETAARQVGMQCLSIRGLASFAHHQGEVVSTGSLVDQLAGLQAALDMIQSKRMEPCVLHLYDLDDELSRDVPQRHEEEKRFWAKLMLALEGNGPEKEECNKNGKFLYTPKLMIVISTSAPLKPGPWMEKLVFPSITLNFPSQEYTKYLWQNDDDDNENACFLDNRMLGLLKGRSARDILCLRQQMKLNQNENTNTNDESTAKEATDSNASIDRNKNRLESLCEELDTIRRKKSSALAHISNVHWDDVGGLAHVRREIMDAIELPLKHPHLFPKSGGRSGILLYGPPGTGKTLVAKAVATECGLPFMSVKGPELLGSYVGESEANIREIFSSARMAAADNAPIAASILFFDELDSLAPRRGGVGDGGGVMERVVATLFAELDGPSGISKVDDSSPFVEGRVFVMGATNRPDLLDPSLLRPGRLDRLVYLGIPTEQEERARVLAAQLPKLQLERDSSPLEMAKAVVSTLPPRLTGADLSTIASGATLLAVQRLCKQADKEQMEQQQRAGPGVLVSIDQILEGWDEEKRTPIVQLVDLLEAAKDVIPSVSQTELERYERLREQYSINEEEKDPIEHEGDTFY